METDENIDEVYESLKRSRFKQQKLSGWRPVPTITSSTVVFIVFGVVFIILGIIILVFTNKIKEIEYRYDEICGTSSTCNLIIEINNDMDSKIMVYFGIDGFHQNTKAYLDRDINPLSPDTFSDWNLDENNPIESKLNRKNIAWEKDKSKYEANNENKEYIVNWIYRSAPFSDFRKLFGRFEDINFKKGQKLYVKVANNFIIPGVKIKKYLVLSTVNIFGGKSSFLGISYIVIGSVSIVTAMIFLAAYNINQKKDKNTKYLK